MLVWSSEFPAQKGTSTDDVLAIARVWIEGSPHGDWGAADLADTPTDEVRSFEKNGHVVMIGRAQDGKDKWSGLRWRYTDKLGRDWSTEVVASEATEVVRVAVRVHCELTKPGVSVPRVKKPYIVRQLLEKVGGGTDGPLVVRDTPYFLKEYEVPLASKLTVGEAGNSLPVLYFSSAPGGQTTNLPNEAAKWFSGMAHTVVEPSRPFSFTLARETGNRNVYGGAIGILWPGGSGRSARFFPGDFEDATALGLAIGEVLRRVLTYLQPTSHCTWATMADVVSRRALEALKAEGSTTLDAYVDAFDRDIEAKDVRIAGLEGELARLRVEVSSLEAQVQSHGHGSLLASGTETPLYPGEVEECLLDALGKALNYYPDDTRRHHVVSDILKHNALAASSADELSEAVSAALATMTKFGKRERRALEEAGFELSDEGKHAKAVFRGDSRYTFTVPYTPSDHRAGKNLAAKINKTLFG